MISTKTAKADLKEYYHNIFPVSLLVDWLLINTSRPFNHRELAFWNYTSGHNYLNRNISFDNSQDLTSYLRNKPIERIEIGAVYQVPPSAGGSTGSDKKTEEKELVFDIDISDYDKVNVRRCCKGKTMCGTCWNIMQCAMKVIDYYMKDAFNWKQYLWVFSGRRGVHMWCSMKEQKQFNEYARSNVLATLVYNESLLDSYMYDHIYKTILYPHFKHILLPSQHYLQTNIMAVELLSLFKFERAHINSILACWKETTDSDVDKFIKLEEYIETSDDSKNLLRTLKKMIFTLLYPKLDEKVTKEVFHLLKAPFSIHPDTGNICIPITTETKFESFRLLNINNVHLDPNYLYSILKPHIEHFSNWLYT